MITYPEALARLLQAAQPLPSRRMPIAAASGCVAAEAVEALVDVPGFDNAAMDGYALRAGETAGARADAPVAFAIAGSIAAGDAADGRTPPGGAFEIMTGARLPADCDAVLPLEQVQAGTAAATPARILVTAPVTAGANVRRQAADFRRGARLLTPGTLLSAEHVMALAAAGHRELAVHPQPRLAVLTTGNELKAPGDPLSASMLNDCNGPYLQALLHELQLPCTALIHVGDAEAAIRDAIAAASAGADVVISTGGVSAGRLDLVPRALASLGASVLFHKVAIRPGKPLLTARLPGGQLYFGLPGNPVAVAVGMRFFVVPACRALAGRTAERYVQAVSAATVRGRRGLRFFAKAVRTAAAGSMPSVRLLPGQESFRIQPLLDANCWAIIDEGRDEVAAGETLSIAPLRPVATDQADRG